MRGAVDFLKTYLTEFQKNDLPGLSAELAYRFLFAIFPFGLFVAALTAFVAQGIGMSDPSGQIMGALGDNLPPDVAAAVQPELQRVLDVARPGLLTIGALAALWAATGGTNALIKGTNKAFEVEDKRSVRRQDRARHRADPARDDRHPRRLRDDRRRIAAHRAARRAGRESAARGRRSRSSAGRSSPWRSRSRSRSCSTSRRRSALVALVHRGRRRVHRRLVGHDRAVRVLRLERRELRRRRTARSAGSSR